MPCDSRSYFDYLDKSVEMITIIYYHRSIGKIPIDDDYSPLTEEIETDSKSAEFKVCDRVRVVNQRNIFTKDYTEDWSREISVTNSVFKTIFRTKYLSLVV